MTTDPARVVAIVYAIPPTSAKFSSWKDGFTAAVDLLPEHLTVEWVNVHPLATQQRGRARAQRARIVAADVVVVKSNWGWIPDTVTLQAVRRLTYPPRTILAISGSFPPPEGELLRYDAVLFETEWYRPFVADHPNALHAFGIDTSIMRPGDGERDIDWLMVGRPAAFKNPQRLAEKSGVRWLLGEVQNHDEVVADLRGAGVVVKDFVRYDELAGLYRRTRNVLVAADLHGGGERTILEGRACGCQVDVPPDNPKLVEVAEGPIFDEQYYARQLIAAIDRVAHHPIPAPLKESALRRAMWRVRRERVEVLLARGRRLARGAVRRLTRLGRR